LNIVIKLYLKKYYVAARIIRKQHAQAIFRHSKLLQKTSSTNKYLAFGRKKAAKVETQRKLDATQNLLVARPVISLAAC